MTAWSRYVDMSRNAGMPTTCCDLRCPTNQANSTKRSSGRWFIRSLASCCCPRPRCLLNIRVHWFSCGAKHTSGHGLSVRSGETPKCKCIQRSDRQQVRKEPSRGRCGGLPAMSHAAVATRDGAGPRRRAESAGRVSVICTRPLTPESSRPSGHATVPGPRQGHSPGRAVPEALRRFAGGLERGGGGGGAGPRRYRCRVSGPRQRYPPEYVAPEGSPALHAIISRNSHFKPRFHIHGSDLRWDSCKL